jgi:hypothetical protein
MNIQPAQQAPTNTPQSYQSLCLCHDTPDHPEQATVKINANQLAPSAELLDVLDRFLRHANTTVGGHLADYLHATGYRPRDRAAHHANLLIDQVSLTAHTLRAQPPTTAKVSASHR